MEDEKAVLLQLEENQRLVLGVYGVNSSKQELEEATANLSLEFDFDTGAVSAFSNIMDPETSETIRTPMAEDLLPGNSTVFEHGNKRFKIDY